MRLRLAILVPTALTLAAADLAVKAALPGDAALAHHRSHAWAALSLALLALLVLLARLPSRLLAAASGVLAAGILGNLLWAAGHAGRVANPFVAGDVAFNLADCLFVAGLLLEAVAAMRLAVRYRHLLPQSTIPVRIVRRLRARSPSGERSTVSTWPGRE